MPVEAFIEKWQAVQTVSQKTAQDFTNDLCDLLQVPRPSASGKEYRFTHIITVGVSGGPLTSGRIDLYKRGCFLWMDAKDERTGRYPVGVKEREQVLATAKTRGMFFARSLNPKPPFLLVVDVGRVIEVYCARNGHDEYTPFQIDGDHRISLETLRKDSVREQLKAVWENPASLLSPR